MRALKWRACAIFLNVDGGEHMFTVGEILDIAIQIEENGESFYRQALEKVHDHAFRKLLLWLADEELRHRQCFLGMRTSLRAASEDLLTEQINGALLQSAVGEHAFSLEEADFGSIRDESDLIETALGFERDSIMFYEMVQTLVTDPEILGHADRIIEEERKHTQLLKERRMIRG
jgi:rubrerythrin